MIGGELRDVVYISCLLIYGVGIAYLIYKYGFTANEAIGFMRLIRPGKRYLGIDPDAARLIPIVDRNGCWTSAELAERDLCDLYSMGEPSSSKNVDLIADALIDLRTNTGCGGQLREGPSKGYASDLGSRHSDRRDPQCDYTDSRIWQGNGSIDIEEVRCGYTEEKEG